MPVVIQSIQAREILDSRGFPTVEADILLSDGSFGRAAVPSGASTGSYEALEIRDNDPHRFWGKGVQTVVHSIHEKIAPALIGQNVGQNADPQKSIDQKLLQLDGTENKSNLGANALLPVSLALARALAQSHKTPLYKDLQLYPSLELPVPLINVINGGKHADNAIDVQEFMLVPSGASCFSEAIRMGAEIFQSLRTLLKKKGFSTHVGDEGGIASPFFLVTEVLDALLQAIEQAHYIPGKDVYLALDVAASELFSNGKYKMNKEQMSSHELVSYYEELVKQYPIFSIEDGLGEDDWEGWAFLTQRLGKTTQLVGDDILVTNQKRLARAIEEQAANAILIKLNQIGTLTETLDVIKTAKANNWATVISHRSGETEDTFIADLAVAVNAQQIKTGSTSRSERLAKYNQLLRIEKELGANASFPSLYTHSPKDSEFVGSVLGLGGTPRTAQRLCSEPPARHSFGDWV
jgi:enolase